MRFSSSSVMAERSVSFNCMRKDLTTEGTSCESRVASG